MNYRLTLSLFVSCITVAGSLSIARADEEAKVTYDEHVRPILREHCFTCHNQNGAKGGLVLDSYSKLRAGGSSGEVVFEEDLESSRLWALVSHQEEPYMPPGQDKLPDAKLAIIRQWIAGGLLENAGDSAQPKKKKTLKLAITPSIGKPEGPPPMPESLIARAGRLYRTGCRGCRFDLQPMGSAGGTFGAGTDSALQFG